MKRTLAVLITLIVVLVVAVASSAAGTLTVSVKDNFFSPKSISIAQGTTLKWVWRGNSFHNVVGGSIRSAVKNKGTFTHKFSKRGTYTFVCTVHTGMAMKVTVH
jgi:plastocyanin